MMMWGFVSRWGEIKLHSKIKRPIGMQNRFWNRNAFYLIFSGASFVSGAKWLDGTDGERNERLKEHSCHCTLPNHNAAFVYFLLQPLKGWRGFCGSRCWWLVIHINRSSKSVGRHGLKQRANRAGCLHKWLLALCFLLCWLFNIMLLCDSMCVWVLAQV